MTRRPIALALRLYRQHRGMTQTELARRAGVHASWIAAIERGARRVNDDHVDQLARAYEIDSLDLIARGSELARAFLRCGEPEPVQLPESNGPKRCKRCGFAPCYCGERKPYNPWGSGLTHISELALNPKETSNHV